MASPRHSMAFGLSLAITSLLTALLVVAKESHGPLMAWMKALTGHHWITHGLATLGLFVILGWVLAQAASVRAGRPGPGALATIIATCIIAGGLIIAGFFWLH